jgi:hypothetical protein
VLAGRRIVPCCLIGIPDVAEIGSVATAAGFSSVWFDPDFQAFQQAHLDGRVPDYCRGCYRETGAQLRHADQ